MYHNKMIIMKFERCFLRDDIRCKDVSKFINWLLKNLDRYSERCVQFCLCEQLWDIIV